jgi:hypothetical protein
MIVKLTYTNALPIPVLLRSNMGSGQPLQPGQPLEMTFDMHEDARTKVAELVLICEPA